MEKLKMYVWEDVLVDYTSGLIVALAENPDHARVLVREKCGYINDEDLSKEPKEITKSEAFYVYGGG